MSTNRLTALLAIAAATSIATACSDEADPPQEAPLAGGDMEQAAPSEDASDPAASDAPEGEATE